MNSSHSLPSLREPAHGRTGAILSRAGLPVVSNRAFIQAWAARRRLGAVAAARRDVAGPVPKAALPLAS